jgi:hypothetical protein
MKNKNVIYGLLLVGAIVVLYFYNFKNKPKDTRSQKEKDCDKIGGSYDRVENFCQRM